jgi:hypothetical protein
MSPVRIKVWSDVRVIKERVLAIGGARSANVVVGSLERFWSTYDARNRQ